MWLRPAVLAGVVVLSAACSSDKEAPGPKPAPTGTVTPEEAFAASCGEGTKWSELYRDIFGPTGKPGSCSLLSSCHGTPEGDGAKSGSGIECFDEKKCRQSFFDKGLVKVENAADPEQASMILGLLRLRKPDGSIAGFMPKSPADYLFPEPCLVRIKGWIAAGAPDD